MAGPEHKDNHSAKLARKRVVPTLAGVSQSGFVHSQSSGTTLDYILSDSSIAAVSGTARRKLPPSPINPFTVSSRMPRQAAVAHGLRQTADFFKRMVRPPFKFGQRVGSEEIRAATVGGNFPSSRFGAVFAKFEKFRLTRFCVGTADAGKAGWLVLFGESHRSIDRPALAQKDLADRPRRSPAADGSQ
jgi:hypothetical protein